MEHQQFDEVVALICKEDPRFDRRAYDFVRLGLNRAVDEMAKRQPSNPDVQAMVEYVKNRAN